MSNVKRKLATILATDCVSFSKHMETQEEKTLESLNGCRKLIDKRIEEYNGRIFHTAGDSVIAEFNSPVECIKAAIAFQNDIKIFNQDENLEPKLSWRVGIHVDDVIVENQNIYGNGVNVAARLESECSPNEILISKVVEQQTSKTETHAHTHTTHTRIQSNTDEHRKNKNTKILLKSRVVCIYYQYKL